MNDRFCHRVDGYTWAFAAAAGSMIIGGGLVAAINSAVPFAHGSWLAAYLVLVGGVAQLLLGVGCLVLPEPRLSARLRGAQVGLWNAGNVVVLGGVLGERFALVLAGSLLVLAALAGFAIGAGPGWSHPGGRLIFYRVSILGLGASVVVGGLLANSSSGG